MSFLHQINENPPESIAFPSSNCELRFDEKQALSISSNLIDLFVSSRSAYRWPDGFSCHDSQKLILDIEEKTVGLINIFSHDSIHELIVCVSDWAGNNKVSHEKIVNASSAEKINMALAVSKIIDPKLTNEGLFALSSLDGISLVIATKIYRFCRPEIGAALDRHTSYFFNSLPAYADYSQSRLATTNFKREWVNAKRVQSRLATYTKPTLEHNTYAYRTAYLPILKKIADKMNDLGCYYKCAVTGKSTAWRPADIEMAAYFWWANNGPK